MTIYIHPTLQRRPASLAMLCHETGLVDQVGRKAVFLTKKAPTQSKPAINAIAILECSRCGFKSNMALRYETCTRCKQGKMIDPWTGGGNAA